MRDANRAVCPFSSRAGGLSSRAWRRLRRMEMKESNSTLSMEMHPESIIQPAYPVCSPPGPESVNLWVPLLTLVPQESGGHHWFVERSIALECPLALLTNSLDCGSQGRKATTTSSILYHFGNRGSARHKSCPMSNALSPPGLASEDSVARQAWLEAVPVLDPGQHAA